jgi:hypothetical protein
VRTLVLLVLVAAPVAFGQQKAFELRGDYLGESLSSFKERHPKAYCYDVNDVTVACFDKTGSFAGHNPYDCEKDCFNDGLGAGFFKGRLTLVNYSVALNGESDVLKLLTDKYGKPNEHYNSEYLAFASWSNGNQVLRFRITKSQAVGRPEISVCLEYIQSPETGDI